MKANRDELLGPWAVFQRKMPGGSIGFELRYHIRDRRFSADARILCSSEEAAFEARNIMNVAIARARA